jgi:hypothetical protein
MRTSRFIIASLTLLTATACGLRLPASPTTQPLATPLPQPSALVEPTLSPPTAITPATENEFAIYLLAQEVQPQQLADPGHLDLEEPPIVSLDDVVSYNEETHEMELTAAGYEKVHGLSVPVSGKAFAVCIDRQPVYIGAFWVSYSSLSFEGVVIDVLRATQESPIIQIALGYPGPDFFQGPDPRSNPRIIQALKQSGKLK